MKWIIPIIMLAAVATSCHKNKTVAPANLAELSSMSRTWTLSGTRHTGNWPNDVFEPWVLTTTIINDTAIKIGTDTLRMVLKDTNRHIFKFSDRPSYYAPTALIHEITYNYLNQTIADTSFDPY